MLPLLLAINVALLGVLGRLWVAPNGQLRGVSWQAPAPLPPAIDAGPQLPDVGADLSRFVATLERPLFVPSRRMPPPPAASAPAVVADVAPDVKVLGLYGSAEAGGGMIARIDGQVRRVRLGASVGRWVLKAVRPGEAVLALGDTEQVYPLHRVLASEPDAPTSAAASPASSSGQRPAAAQTQIDQARERALRRLRDMNARRARAGLPPLPE